MQTVNSFTHSSQEIDALLNKSKSLVRSSLPTGAKLEPEQSAEHITNKTSLSLLLVATCDCV